ncbi:MAG: type IV pilus assembly protein PilM [Pirellulales bacterium]|nr:type IV pilus assembly protein PilM [Pirellulales bacterium]
MARSGAVWGIDLGQCALKALRARATADQGKIEADAFDFIEYPKILSQPDADPPELIAEALKQFLSRNSVRGDAVAISVSGQAGLAKFIKLPPVESKKIPDIVRYEAKQQIPFDLNDVIWDYQRIGVGTEEEGFVLETEIGLFAMKRDAVFRALEPFRRQGIEVDVVQLTPECLYNFLLYDQLRSLPPPDEYDPEDPPESVVVLSLGTDATDLVITNGYRVWQRSIPLGGNHFTKALTKEMKLTFAKAEHLKRNATAAADPKAVFQAMRPVFNDLVTELQRSISYFSNLDRAAKIGRIVALGNAMKLPGLRRYLGQSLGYEILRTDGYEGMVGSAVTASPVFQENVMSFGVCYGLVLQGLGRSGIRTNLLPREILKDRLIRSKKPWAVAAAASLLLGCAVSCGAYALNLGSVAPDLWKTPLGNASSVVQEVNNYQSEASTAQSDFEAIEKIGSHLISNVEGRLQWLELLKALGEALPKDNVSAKEIFDKPLAERKQIFIKNLEAQQVPDVSMWYQGVKKWYSGPKSGTGGEEPAAAAGVKTEPASPSPDAGGFASDAGGGTMETTEGPKGEGWIIKIEGYHYHNAHKDNDGAQYVKNTFIKNLLEGEVEFPSADRKGTEKVSMNELGISYPLLYDPQQIWEEPIQDPNAAPAEGAAAAGPLPAPGKGPAYPGAAPAESTIKVKRFDFNLQFCWQPKLPTDRLEARKEAEKKKTADGSATEENF